jgi:hypothetical protein
MAFLRIKRRGERQYFYIVESRRRGATVRQKTLEFLGDKPDSNRLKRALEYWQMVKNGKRKKPGRRARRTGA